MIKFQFFVISITFVHSLVFAEDSEYTDCKLSLMGLEYSGSISRSEIGKLCQSWTMQNPIHPIDPSFTDEKFPEQSLKKAKNYCRNPSYDPNGPWCYTMDPMLLNDTCGIPICYSYDCKLTGIGMDYSGLRETTINNKVCLIWDYNRNKVKKRQFKYETYSQKKFSKWSFPDESRGSAENYCRNPDSDPGGPWCFIESDSHEYGVVEKDYCNIPLCEDRICMVYTRNNSKYTHYTYFNETLRNLTFSIKLWNPDDVHHAEARLLLALFALPLSPEQIDKMKIGIEIYISNKKSALRIGNKQTVEYESSFNIIKSYKFVTFSVSWNDGIVALYLEGEDNPVFLAEYKYDEGLFGVNKNSFFYYSLQGTNVLWALPLCDDDNECETHVTTGDYTFERFWPLHETDLGYDLIFNLRAMHSAVLIFQISPSIEYPRMILKILRENKTMLIIKQFKDSPEMIEFIGDTPGILNYFTWREFTLSVFGKTLQFYYQQESLKHILFESELSIVQLFKWFSPSSIDTIAHWTFYCKSSETDKEYYAFQPECLLSSTQSTYNGTQSISIEGYPCVPWTYDIDIVTKYGIDYAKSNWNYCRYQKGENDGIFCNAISKNGIERHQCKIRLCKSTECRLAGTGNDYIGTVNITRSNRTCQRWLDNEPHKIDKYLLNASYFAEQDVQLANNYCRDPNRNISGPWCFTTDPNVPFDLCNARDCAKTEECTILTKGNGLKRGIYILPQWKEQGMFGGLYFSLKEWNPSLLDGILFEFTPIEGRGFMQLIIGAENNEKVILWLGENRKNKWIEKQKTLPHLIPAGKWNNFWIQIRKGEIKLGYEGIPTPFFEWYASSQKHVFEPILMTYMSIQDNLIGVHFRCNECQTERTHIHQFTRIMSLGIWNRTNSIKYSKITFYLRGTGVALIPLMLLPGSGEYYGITVGDFDNYILFIYNSKADIKTLKAANLKRRALSPDTWSNLTLLYSEKKIEIIYDNATVMRYTSEKPMLFYWFSVGAENGQITWAANCIPPDIDGPPKDGRWSRWSPWVCSVTCGGGTGYKVRRCDNPYPNVFGKLCEGPSKVVGLCNTFPCGEISVDTLKLIQKNLRKERSSLIVYEGSQVVLETSTDLFRLVKTESPESYYVWSLNGFPLNNSENIVIANNYVDIYKISSAQSGIYTCSLQRSNGKKVTLKVFSVAVRPNKTLFLRATFNFSLPSKAVVLNYIYSDLSQKWLLNDKTYVDYGIIKLSAVAKEHLKITYSHGGIWQCVVEQKDLGFTWVTNIVSIEVLHPPNILTYLMEDDLTKPIFGRLKNEKTVGMILLIFVLVTLLIFIVVCVSIVQCVEQRQITKNENKPIPEIRRRKRKKLRHRVE